MIGIGTMINSVSIVAGGLAGCFVGKLFKPDQQESVNKACGISVIFIAIAGAMQGMLQIQEGSLVSGKSMLVVLCLAIGTILGELLGIEKGFEHFGEWLKNKTGNSEDAQFVNAFVTASLTVCIGAMAIVGAIQDGIMGDYSVLAVKSVLDFIIIAVMTSSLAWDISDTFNGLMMIPNLIAVVLLSPLVFKITRNYVDRKIKGKDVKPMYSFDAEIQAAAEASQSEDIIE